MGRGTRAPPLDLSMRKTFQMSFIVTDLGDEPGPVRDGSRKFRKRGQKNVVEHRSIATTHDWHPSCPRADCKIPLERQLVINIL